MPENPTDSPSTANVTTIKRYAPPNQRNRPLGRRKSGGDRIDRMINNYTNEAEKSQVATSRNMPITDHGDVTGSNLVNENPRPGLIPMHLCCKSDAFQLMNERWTAAINACNDPSTSLAERPVMYTGSSTAAWGAFRLPHQMMTPAVSAGQMDFLSELQRAMRDATASSNT
ncbi:hypothetical protein NMG60_11014354 [Bertholletia excelsa]